MTCKDCFHYKACKDTYEMCFELDSFDKSIEMQDYDNMLDYCKLFKDKDKVIELPCKVGDTVYKVWYQPCHLGVSYPDSIDCDGCYDECDIKKSLFEIEVPNIDFIFRQFISDKNNSVYFITKEEAEKALKLKENEK